MRISMLAAALTLIAAPAAAQTSNEDAMHHGAGWIAPTSSEAVSNTPSPRVPNDNPEIWSDHWGQYPYRLIDWNRPDPATGGYFADDYRFRDADRRYGEVRLKGSDRIYRGRDGRYYCRRWDGTTAPINGDGATALFGELLQPGASAPLRDMAEVPEVTALRDRALSCR